MAEHRPPVVVIPRAHFRVLLGCVGVLSLGAVIGASVSALNALDSHDGLDAVETQLEDQRDQNAALEVQLDCRYVLSADVNRIQADIFVTTAQALAAARRRDSTAVDLYTTRLDQLAADLSEASDVRARAIEVCDTEPENVLG